MKLKRRTPGKTYAAPVSLEKQGPNATIAQRERQVEPKESQKLVTKKDVLDRASKSKIKEQAFSRQDKKAVVQKTQRESQQRTRPEKPVTIATKISSSVATKGVVKEALKKPVQPASTLKKKQSTSDSITHKVQQENTSIIIQNEPQDFIQPVYVAEEKQRQSQAVENPHLVSLRKAMAAFQAQEELREATNVQSATDTVITKVVDDKALMRAQQVSSSVQHAKKKVHRGLSQELRLELSKMAMEDTPKKASAFSLELSEGEKAKLQNLGDFSYEEPLLGSLPEPTLSTSDRLQEQHGKKQAKVEAHSSVSERVRPQWQLPSAASKAAGFPDLSNNRRMIMHHAPNITKVRAVRLRQKQSN